MIIDYLWCPSLVKALSAYKSLWIRRAFSTSHARTHAHTDTDTDTDTDTHTHTHTHTHYKYMYYWLWVGRMRRKENDKSVCRRDECPILTQKKRVKKNA